MIMKILSIHSDNSPVQSGVLRSRFFKLSLVVLLCSSLVASGCNASSGVKGGAIGAGAGAIIGGIIGNQYGNTAVGAIIGAAVGGTAGGLIGKYMDDQAREMQKDIENAKIERVGEGIKITFNSGLLFDSGNPELKSASQGNIADLARILKKYDDTNILIEGHTDADGSEDFNLRLSESRANAISGQIKGQGVSSGRITTVGYGEKEPVASNAGESGKQQNRRVEVAIFANDALKQAAERNQVPKP